MLRSRAFLVALELLPHAQAVEHRLRATGHVVLKAWRVLDRIAQLHECELGVASLPDQHDLQSALQLGPHHRRERRAVRQFEAAPLARARLGAIGFKAPAMRAITGRHFASKLFPERAWADVPASLVHVPDDVVIPKNGDLAHCVAHRTAIPMGWQAFQTNRLTQDAPIMVPLKEQAAMDLAAAGWQREFDDRSKTSAVLRALSLLDRHCHGHQGASLLRGRQRMAKIALAMTGRVTNVHSRGGYFWIRTNEARVFFGHRDQLQGGQAAFESLRIGSWVTFNEYPTRPGPGQKPRATSIKHHPSWFLRAEKSPTITTSTSSLAQEHANQ